MTESRFQKWWNNNPDKREEINAKRRAKYKNSAAIREQAKHRVAESRARSRSTKKRGPNKSFVVPKPDGDEQVFIGAGELSDLLGVTVPTLVRWERIGVIPKGFWRDKIRRRWYSQEFAEELSRIVNSWRKKGPKTLQELKRRVKLRIAKLDPLIKRRG